MVRYLVELEDNMAGGYDSAGNQELYTKREALFDTLCQCRYGKLKVITKEELKDIQCRKQEKEQEMFHVIANDDSDLNVFVMARSKEHAKERADAYFNEIGKCGEDGTRKYDVYRVEHARMHIYGRIH